MGTVAQEISRAGLVAIVRAPSEEGLVDAAGAMFAGGVRVMEVTLNTPGALRVIAEIRTRWPAMVCGAGTVLGADDARAAIGAGAQFIVTPVMRGEVVGLCNKHDVPVMPGCTSPTEMLEAWRLGADFVKVFPANRFGLEHMRAALEALPQLRLVPTGGVTAENVHEYFAAGCAAVGAGATLVSRQVLQEKDWRGLETAARKFVDAVDRARR
jgi:2-dehydro-3-deoxyphosphogluconate aldolase/(4S)-4-hydroxy-2-oxoglutarate aldolase